MRLTTRVWAKFESKGRPAETITVGPEQVGIIARRLVGWLVDTSMGHCLKITIARSEDELERLTRTGQSHMPGAGEELLANFEAALSELGFPTPPAPETETDDKPALDWTCDACGKRYAVHADSTHDFVHDGIGYN